MTIIFNGSPLSVPKEIVTLSDLAKFKNVPSQGAAVAVNDKLVKRDLWEVTKLNELDNITVITAAYGG